MKILLVEDDITLAFAIKEYFVREHYEIVVFYSVQEALRSDLSIFDVAILDINLPDGLGYEIVPYLKDTPFLFLTVQDSQEHILQGFDLGAQDYLTKPFSLKELQQRVNVILRNITAHTIQLGPLKVELKNAEVFLDSEPIHLSTTEYKLLLLLVNSQNIVSGQSIIEAVWGYTDSNTVSVTIKRLRDKLDPYIEIISIRGKGYKIQCSI